MRFLYIVVAYLLAPVVIGALAFRGFRDRSHWTGFSQRFGLGARVAEPSIWVHAVSVGEVQAAAPLVNALLERFPTVPLVLTTVTPTGRARAQALFKNRVDVRYVPIDLPGGVRRFFSRVKPRLAVILETEIWPNLYDRCGKLGVPLVMASARISPKSVNRYRRLVGLFRGALSHGIFIAAQSAEDAERFKSIGANPDRTHVIGNIKFDFGYPPDIEARGHELRTLLGVHRPVWVAGSTHAKEEDEVLAAHALVRQRFTNALLVLVPRHPPRFGDVAGALKERGIPFVTRTSGATPGPDTQVFLLDTLGELPPFYAAGDVAFVGGSLVPIGGHNLLEPAALSEPIVAGPHNFNSADIAKLLIERGAVKIVHDAPELAQVIGNLLSDPAARAQMGAAGRRAVDQNRGAVDRLMAFIRPLLP
ncbi:MAG TPA: lipid IV(A) 3-deoxy-D-manno-octulosonic acid transferase [Steroidobacteraceae bacterium]|nr:lipid IV(A) 3-deoxy-D-manno-octulosonic acid transferase [Steroidobacteraceae bacterium]